jgi:hypothetical protein
MTVRRKGGANRLPPFAEFRYGRVIFGRNPPLILLNYFEKMLSPNSHKLEFESPNRHVLIRGFTQGFQAADHDFAYPIDSGVVKFFV